MPSGKMIRWHSEKGFGFIKPDDGGEDLFCHVSSLLDGDGSVGDGDSVNFKIDYDDRKGKDHAVEVSVSGGGGGRRGGGGRSRSRGRDDSRRPPPRRRDDSRGPPPRRGGGGRDNSRGPPPRRGGGGGGGRDGKSGTGEMVRWHAEKGFGFVKPDDGGEDIFTHVSGLADGDGSVQDGDRVSYVIEFDERKGKDRATQVTVEGGRGGRG